MLDVLTPTDVDEDQSDALRKLAELRGESVDPEPEGFFSRLRSRLAD